MASENINLCKTFLKMVTCPISDKGMTDPVTLETGITCERSAITQRLFREYTCPVTHKKLETYHLHPNMLVRELLSDMGLPVMPLTPLPTNGNLEQVKSSEHCPKQYRVDFPPLHYCTYNDL